MDIRLPKISNILLALILGAAALIVLVFLVISQLGSLQEVREQVTIEEQSLDAAGARLIRLQELSRRGPELASHLENVEQLLPPEVGEDEILFFFEHIAWEAEVNFNEISFGSRQETDDYTIMPFDVSFEGDYNTLLRLLQQLQYERWALRVENIHLTGDQVDMSVKAFYRE